MHAAYLERYALRLCEASALFPGLEHLLEILDSAGLPWGVVTNKPTRFTKPLLHALELSQRSACVICGDTLEKKKPHPEPILHACSIVGCQPNETIYVGDAQRDIEAGRHAGTKTLVAMFGYIGEDQQPQQWGADGYVDTPQEIIHWLSNHMPN